METSLNSPAEHLRLAKHQRADRSAFRLEPLVDMPSRRVVHDSGARPAELLLFAPRRRSEVANRIINSSIAAGLLVVASPVLVVAAIAIKLTSPGPIFYLQARVGLNRRRRRQHEAGDYDRRSHDLGGQAFKIYKLRTMRSDAERRSGVVWAQRRDPRATPVGRLLRKLRIDEIPQLLNVLKGDMNIVGPRPERPSLVAKLSRRIPEYPLRQLAKPGITGLAQISQSYDACLEDVRRKVGYDLAYLARQDLIEDLRIMLRTVPVILFQKGW